MPNPIAQQWWHSPADSKEKEALKEKWVKLPTYCKERIEKYLKEKCESYNYPIPETDEEYYFYICYWPQSIAEAFKKEALVDEKIIMHWWNKRLTEIGRKKLEKLHRELDINQKQLVNQQFELIGHKKLSEMPNLVDCFYLCYLKHINLPGFEKTNLRENILQMFDFRFSMVTTDIVSSAQSHREALDRQGLGKKFRELFSKNIQASIPIALSLALLGSTILTIKQAYHSAKKYFLWEKTSSQSLVYRLSSRRWLFRMVYWRLSLKFFFSWTWYFSLSCFGSWNSGLCLFSKNNNCKTNCSRCL